MVKTPYKELLQGRGLDIFRIFWENWYSLKEASEEYVRRSHTKRLKSILKKIKKGKVRNHRTVGRYFYKFKNAGWLDSEEVIKINKRFSKLGKEHNYPSKCIRYRTNLTAFYDYIEKRDGISLNQAEKNILNLLTDIDIRKGYTKYMKSSIDDRFITFFFIFLVDNKYNEKSSPLIEKITKPFNENFNGRSLKEDDEKD